jgi:predicted metallopeptidase
MIEYHLAPDLRERVMDIIELLRFHHINQRNLHFVRSRGSTSKRTIARIHGLGRVWQRAMGLEPAYIIEVISERFDNLNLREQDRVLVHELLHVPQAFRGGFRHHKNQVTQERVETWYRRLEQKRLETGA